MYRLDLEAGKYTIVLDERKSSWEFKALRYGEEWRDLCGDGLVMALVHKIQELQGQLRVAEAEFTGR